jgi:4-alpha-glucanotransferase
MERWGLLGMNVAQFGFGRDAAHAIPTPDHHDLACLNTHDTPTFKAFWTGDDLEQNQRYGVIDQETAEHERPGREQVRRAVREALQLPTDADPNDDFNAALRGVLERLAESDASALLVTLEDLWGERLPQNVPGVPADQYPSWRRRVDPNRAAFMKDPEVAAFIKRLIAARDRASKRASNREGATT